MTLDEYRGESARRSPHPYRELDNRFRILEERTAREGRDPLGIIRERYGRKA